MPMANGPGWGKTFVRARGLYPLRHDVENSKIPGGSLPTRYAHFYR